MGTRTVVIETPRGSSEKFAFDPEHQAFMLSRVLPVGMVFPGCRVECRIVGALLARQQEKKKGTAPRAMIRNDRLIAIPVAAHDMDGVKSLEDLPASVLEELEQFFVNYHEREGTRVQVLQRASASRAEKLLAKHESS